MRIAEIFRSRQGEGLLTGTDSVFIRTSGCNLRCWFCDTPYTSWEPQGQSRSAEEVLAEALKFECLHVVVTGGEPLLWPELVPLTARLAAAGRHVTVETAGTVDAPITCHLLSLSPKFASSAPDPGEHPGWSAEHHRRRHVPAVVRRLVRDYPYQVKFVIDRPADCEEVVRYLQEFPEIERRHVHLMPQGTTPAELAQRRQWLEPYCRDQGFHFCPRMQIEWFGLRRGT